MLTQLEGVTLEVVVVSVLMVLGLVLVVVGVVAL